jgi:methyl-accepting chemotaxis protein
MEKVSIKEIREIAENIVEKTNESTNEYDAVNDVTLMLRGILEKMEIAVEKIKNNTDCNCAECKCEK